MTTPASASQHFCLKWNHHQHTLVTLFSSLLNSNTFVDCTLAAGGKQIKAHKMILSACSPYFKEILIEHGDMHPIIILNNVQFSELVAIVEFMYRGEVNVTQEQLPTFLKAANALQIKGLTNEDEESSKEAEKKTTSEDNNSNSATLKPGDDDGPKDFSMSDGFQSNYQSTSDDSVQSSVRLKVDTDDDSTSHPGPSNSIKTEHGSIKQESYGHSSNSNPTFMGLLQIQQQRFSTDEALPHFSGLGFSKAIQLRRPNATEKDASFKCDACPKFYRSKTSLNLHKRWECGKEPKFACPYCDKKCHQKGNLKVHIISRHRDRINPDVNNTM